MTQPLAIFVAPQKPRNVHDREGHRQLEAVRADALKAAEARGWRTRTFRTQLHWSTRPAETGRRLHLLGGWDAAEIYNAVHRNDVAVIQLGDTARVLPHPRHEPSVDRTVTLANFIRHKAFFAAINQRLPFAEAFDRFAETLELVECDGERDPRCLPMHVFAPGHDHEAHPLSDADGFKKKYGAPASMTDPKGRLWARPKGRHGGDILHIRGAEIAAGFHWDVNCARNISELTTTTEIWSLPKGAYVNVTPNASVRRGQRSAQALAKRSLLLERTAEAREAKPGQRPTPTQTRGNRRRG